MALGRAMRHDISKVLVPPAASMTASAPRPSAASRTAASIFPHIQTLASSALSAILAFRQFKALRVDVNRDDSRGFRETGAHHGGQTHRSRSDDGHGGAGLDFCDFCTSPTGRQNIAQEQGSSSSTPSGMGAHVLSAKGTRMNSAWQPSIRQPSSQPPWMQLFTHPRWQKKHSRASCGVRPLANSMTLSRP